MGSGRLGLFAESLFDIGVVSLNLIPGPLRPLVPLKRGELEQIQFLLGHASVQTTERYLGCKQKLRHAVNDNLGLEDS
jgi:hypothetical protein